MDEKIVRDGNEVPLKRGDHIWNLNEGFLTHDRKGIIVEIVDENHLRYSPENDPCGIMNESPWLVHKTKDSALGYRDDYRDECDRLAEENKKLKAFNKSHALEAYEKENKKLQAQLDEYNKTYERNKAAFEIMKERLSSCCEEGVAVEKQLDKIRRAVDKWTRNIFRTRQAWEMRKKFNTALNYSDLDELREAVGVKE